MGIAATSTDAKLAATTASLKLSLERMKQIAERSKSTEALARTSRLQASWARLATPTTLLSAMPTSFSVSLRSGTRMDELSGSIDASLAEIRRLQEGIERRRDSLARQMEVTAQAVARISGVTASTPTSSTATHHALRPVAPTWGQLEVAPPAHRPPLTFTGELVPFRVAGRMAEPIPGDLVVDCTGEGVGLMEADQSCSPAEFNGPERSPASALTAPLLLTDRIVAPGDPELATQPGADKVFEEIHMNTATTVVIEMPFNAVVREEEDCNCEGTLVQEESDDVLTHVGGSSLFLEFVMDISVLKKHADVVWGKRDDCSVVLLPKIPAMLGDHRMLNGMPELLRDKEGETGEVHKLFDNMSVLDSKPQTDNKPQDTYEKGSSWLWNGFSPGITNAKPEYLLHCSSRNNFSVHWDLDGLLHIPGGTTNCKVSYAATQQWDPGICHCHLPNSLHMLDPEAMRSFHQPNHFLLGWIYVTMGSACCLQLILSWTLLQLARNTVVAVQEKCYE